MEKRDQLVSIAKRAHKAKRYDEIVEAMSAVAKLDVELTAGERNLLAVGYEKVVDERRLKLEEYTNFREKELMLEISQKKLSGGYKRTARQRAISLKNRLKDEIKTKCHELLSLIDQHLLPSSRTKESLKFWKNLKDDYFHFAASRLLKTYERARNDHEAGTSRAIISKKPPETELPEFEVIYKPKRVNGTKRLWRNQPAYYSIEPFGSKHKGERWAVSAEKAKNLKKYQWEGVKWLISIHHGGIGGGIFGDDMGLGKTKQICCFLAGAFQSKMVTKVLLVIPQILLQSWTMELSWFDLSLKKLGSNPTKTTMDIKQKGGILVTTYGASTEVFEACHIDFHYIIFDEGQELRNMTETYKKWEKVKADHKIIVSGTPIQNRIMELWNLFKFCRSELFVEKTIKKKLRDIEKGIYSDSTTPERQLCDKACLYVAKKIKNFYICRMKEDVMAKALPVKTELVIWLPLSPCQLHLYKDFIQSRSNHTTGAEPFADIRRLEQLCDHLLLDKANRVGDDLEKELENEILSSKIDFVKNLMNQLTSAGHSVLIFSQYLGTLDFLEKSLRGKHELFRIDGTRVNNTQTVKNFQDFNGPAILLSSEVGGTGITLIKADRVVIMSPDWNPSSDNQIADRAYRIGQTEDVVVYRLISSGTIEEYKYKHQVHKEILIKRVMLGQKKQSEFCEEEVTKEAFKTTEEGFYMSKTCALFKKPNDLDLIHSESLKEHIEVLRQEHEVTIHKIVNKKVIAQILR